MEVQRSVFLGENAAVRLATLGFESEPLRDVVRQSLHAFISCSPNHPPLVRGIWAWGEAVRALREYVLPKGLRRSDVSNYSMVIDDERGIAVAVATGNEATGIPELSPSTRAQKGIETLMAVVANQAQLSLFAETAVVTPMEPVDGEARDRVTWILLIHRAETEVRCELSLPSSIGEDGRIDAWHERIILEAIPGDAAPVVITLPRAPDIDIDVQRRA